MLLILALGSLVSSLIMSYTGICRPRECFGGGLYCWPFTCLFWIQP